MWHLTCDTGHIGYSEYYVKFAVWERLKNDKWHMTHDMWHMTGGF